MYSRRVDLIVRVSIVILLRYAKSTLFSVLFQVTDGLASEAPGYSTHRPKKAQRRSCRRCAWSSAILYDPHEISAVPHKNTSHAGATLRK